MIDEASSFLPAWVKTAPFPALSKGESSKMRMEAITGIQTSAAVLENSVTGTQSLF